mmetsp:Transcript_54632/g.97123  ORF Transcript_54632/g.97123 Transcript_54632/m.97123 type:complete len:236 (+) Transcript_54632:1123-1830(+)
MSFRLVIPINSTLFRASTPSIFESSWLTMLSPTPVPSLLEPRDLQIASISSKMMRCSSLSSPFSACSASASLNRLRMFSSVWPTYLLSTSGPLMILGSLQFSIFPIWRAISVLPVPGGPYSRIPFTWEIPSFSMTAGGKMRDPKARRKTLPNSVFSPPMPRFSKFQSFLKTSAPRAAVDKGMFTSLIFPAEVVPTFNRGLVSGPTIPINEPSLAVPDWTVMLASSMTARSLALSK